MKAPCIATQLSSQVNSSEARNKKMLLKQLSSLRFLLRQGLAIRGHNEQEGNLYQILKHRCDNVPELQQWLSDNKYLSHDIVNEMM